MQVRIAKDDDYQECAALHELIVPGRNRERFLQSRISGGRMYVAVEEGRVIGFATFEPDFIGCLYISLLMVHPRFRRQGVARKLVEHVAAHSNDGRLFSSTEEDNEISIKMHEALGFRRSGYIDNLPQQTRELIYFRDVKD